MSILKRASAMFVGLMLGAVLVLTSSTYAFEDLTNEERAEKFGVIMQIIMDETVNEDGVDPDYLYNIAIEAVFKELGDKHGSYYTREVTEKFKEDMRPDDYGGIGTSIIEYKKGDLLGAVLLSPFDNSPAKKAGLRTGDVITHVLVGKKWKAYEEGKLGEFIKLIKGPKNTKVKVIVVRDGKKLPSVTITRAITKFQNVWVRIINPGIVYARIVQFNADVAVDLRKQILPMIKKLKKRKKFKGIILDLRSNPGGILHEAVRIGDLFINKRKEIITVKTRNEGDIRYEAKKKPLVPENTPMVVLIDDSSASASELVAGALMQQEVAIAIGVKSFGKGSVQTIIDISDGSAVKVTSARYYPAGGLDVDGVGIEPTIKVKPDFDPSLMETKEESREEYLRYYFARTSADPKKDVQLKAAVDWIKSR